MQIVYLSDARLPSRSTNAMQVMHMCAAFVRNGFTITLVHPRVPAPTPEGYSGDLWAFYGIKDEFPITALPAFPFESLSMGSLPQRAARTVMMARYALARSRRGEDDFVCYARSFLGAWSTARARSLWGRQSACRGVALELHDEPRSISLLNQVDLVFAISDALRRRLVDLNPSVRSRTRVEPDGADLNRIRPDLLDRGAARRKLGLAADAGPVVVYAGRVNQAKGAGTVVDAMPSLRHLGTRLILVGKVYDEAIAKRAAKLDEMTSVGFVPPASVPEYLAAADILVLPSTWNLRYAAYTSPLKLFEYMASGRPVVAADLPVLREILAHEHNALLYEPDDAAGLAAAVERLWREKPLGQRLAKQAWRDVQQYGWDARARRIGNELARLAADDRRSQVA
jgi:glycosyltransferase involved in cell wall biosynthesis